MCTDQNSEQYCAREHERDGCLRNLMCQIQTEASVTLSQ